VANALATQRNACIEPLTPAYHKACPVYNQITSLYDTKPVDPDDIPETKKEYRKKIVK